MIPHTMQPDEESPLLPQGSRSGHPPRTGDLVEQAQEMETPTGKGYVAYWRFENVRMDYAHWHRPEPFVAEWHPDPETVHLHFNLRGRTVLKNDRTGTAFRLASAEHNLFHCTGVEGSIRSEEMESETFTLQFDTSQLS